MIEAALIAPRNSSVSPNELQLVQLLSSELQAAVGGGEVYLPIAYRRVRRGRGLTLRCHMWML